MINASAVATIPVDVLLEAYAHGAFPMAHEDGELYWHQPDPRAVFDLDRIAPDRTTARIIRSGRFRTTVDQAFNEVVRGCADREESWIDDRIADSYAELHRAGHAHSVEVWHEDELVGGIYGVVLGAAFFGESMFGDNNAGKVAFHVMVAHLRRRGFRLFDTQYINPFTASLGAYEVPKSTFEGLLASAIQLPVRFN